MTSQMSLFGNSNIASTTGPSSQSSSDSRPSSDKPSGTQSTCAPSTTAELGTRVIDLGRTKLQVSLSASPEQIASAIRAVEGWTAEVVDGKVKARPARRGLPKAPAKLMAPGLSLQTGFCHECMRVQETVREYGVRHSSGESWAQLCDEAATALRSEGFKIWRLGERKAQAEA